MATHHLTGQSSMAGTEPRLGDLARRQAAAPLMARKPQMPCDVGLFSDEAAQVDLIGMLMDPVDE